jgi:hypothetical protein
MEGKRAGEWEGERERFMAGALLFFFGFPFSPSSPSGHFFWRRKIKEVLKLTVKDVKIFISTAKIAKGHERSSIFWRIFASFRG